ncbi:TetR/AcrR family transcriptional regulator, partial [Mycolicibacterium porcinum]|uniref:TetR/AcrR family transcriptional regulator n=2 Tax=Mycolicibacterium porcinum TaxID=39693 RepID=UPI00084834CC
MISKRGPVLHNGRVRDSATQREAQRRQTRARLLDAAIVEFQRAGTNAADINAIVKAAGVARSTFYFHFPTKEHVLLELIRRDEASLADELGRFLDAPHDLASVLKTIVSLVMALESRWGSALFHDVIGLYLSPTRPEREQWTSHPIFLLLAAEIERARIRGELYDDVDAHHSAAFFLLGVYALLTTVGESRSERDVALEKFVTSTLRSLQPGRACNRSARDPPDRLAP